MLLAETGTPRGLARIVESVFETMLCLEVGAGGTPWFPGTERLTSAVHLAGDWNGAVLLELDRGQACRIAGRFLAVDPPETVDDVVRDVLGELASMIGGNLKCVLKEIQVSMPSVVDGSGYGGPEIQERLAFQSAEGPFWVTLVRCYGLGM